MRRTLFSLSISCMQGTRLSLSISYVEHTFSLILSCVGDTLLSLSISCVPGHTSPS